jgi:hypothetical protein
VACYSVQVVSVVTLYCTINCCRQLRAAAPVMIAEKRKLPFSSSTVLGIKGSDGRRLLDADVSASSTAAGTHSASGNLTTAASYRAGPNAAGIGVALIDGSAAADNGTASVSAKGASAPMVRSTARVTHKQ